MRGIKKTTTTTQEGKPKTAQPRRPSVYKEEHLRLEGIILESEKIWEERTFGIAAGGLSLSFAVFSFYLSQYSARSFTLWMGLIVLGYVVCLVLNYWSHRKTIQECRRLQEVLRTDKAQGLPYDEARLREHYAKGNKMMERINRATGALLIVSVVSTLFYTFLILS